MESLRDVAQTSDHDSGELKIILFLDVNRGVTLVAANEADTSGAQFQPFDQDCVANPTDDDPLRRFAERPCRRDEEEVAIEKSCFDHRVANSLKDQPRATQMVRARYLGIALEDSVWDGEGINDGGRADRGVEVADDAANLGSLFAVEDESRLVKQRSDALTDRVRDTDNGFERGLGVDTAEHPAERFRCNSRRRRDCVLRTPARVDSGT